MTGTDLVKAPRSASTIDAMPPTPSSGLGRAVSATQRIGVPGYAITNGYVLPRDVDKRISQRERYRLYEENLVNVAMIATGVRSFLDVVAGAAWTWQPADDSSEAIDIAEFVEDAMNDMETSFSRVVRRQAKYKFDGFSIQEWSLKSREDGRIGFRDIEPRPCHTIERWDIDDRGSVRGVLQRNPNNGQEIYLEKERLVYVTDDTLSDSPEGLGLFRNLIRPAAGIARFEDLEHIGFETDLQGVPIGRAPLAAMAEQVAEGNLKKEDVAQFRFIIDNFIHNHVRGLNTGMTLDSATYKTTDDKGAPSNQRLWDVELLKSGGTSHAQINEAIKRKTQEIARLLGTEHLLLGSEGGGSLALSQSSIKRFHGMANSCLGELGDVNTKQMIAPLMKYNNIPRALWPKPKPEEVEYRSVEEVTTALVNLAQAGVPLMPGDAAVDEVRDLIGISRTDPKADIAAQIEAGLLAMGAGTGDAGAGGGKQPARRLRIAGGTTSRQSGAKPGTSKGLDGGLSASLASLQAYLEGASA